MKRIIATIIVLVLCFAMAGCPAIEDGPIKEAYTGNNSSSDNVNTESQKTTFGLLETAAFSNLKFTALEIKESQGNTYLKPDDGKVYVGVKFEVENISNEEQSISSLLLFEAYVDDVKASQSISGATALAESTLDGTIAAGKKIIGWYVIEVAENWSEIEINAKAELLSSSSATFVFSK